MASLWVTLLVLLLATTSSSFKTRPSFLATPEVTTTTTDTSSSQSFLETLSVFKKGSLRTKSTRGKSFWPPSPLFIVSPVKPGLYPVLLFFHGCMLRNEDYSDVFNHVASHGFIVVAPQLFQLPRDIISFLILDQTGEIDRAAKVAEWLPSNLQKLLSKEVAQGVLGDVSKLVISGHSRGGKTAFALVLGIVPKTKPMNVNFSALIGVDPVAGVSSTVRTKPYVLTSKPGSLDVSVPSVVIGSGLGTACTPKGVNHEEFFDELKDNSAHFVTTEFGHMDMLDDNVPFLEGIMRSQCKSRTPRGPMRSTVGGIVVAFLKACLYSDTGDYKAIEANPSLAPAKLSRVEIKGTEGHGLFYAQA